MELTCFLFPGWEPRIRPAVTKRHWMDAAPESFPYRCLPLGIANSHGWEILSPCGFEVVWNGGSAAQDIVVSVDQNVSREMVPVALFGQGIFTIHIEGLFRTAPGWNLYVSGPPNTFKDGAAPLTAIIESDWSPYSFTMNWRLIRPHQRVRFEETEPIAHIFPMPRGMLESVEPAFVPIDDDPDLKSRFEQWSRSRDAFHQEMQANPPERPADRWQKLYYRGQNPDGTCPIADHETKIQARAFAHPERAGGAAAAMARPMLVAPLQHAAPQHAAPQHAATVSTAPNDPSAKYAWLLDTLGKQRELSSNASTILRVKDLPSETFLDAFYAPGRPVIIAGEIASWPALDRWNPEYLSSLAGEATIEYQGRRTASNDSERYKEDHRMQMPFNRFIEMITTETGNDAYLTAYNSAANSAALAPLQIDVGRLDKFLLQSPEDPGGMMWIGPSGTFTPLHHDLTNNLLVQVVGRKRVILAAATDLPKLYNDTHVFSSIKDVTDPNLDLIKFCNLRDVRFFDVTLMPGEILFIPIGWWHQVTALDFCTSITYTNFKWKNDFFETYPVR